MFTYAKHKKTGEEFKVICCQLLVVTSIIRNAYPVKHPINSHTDFFPVMGNNNLDALSWVFDEQALRDFKNGPKNPRIFHLYRGGINSDLDKLPMLGVPESISRKFRKKQKAKGLARFDRKKTRLTVLEINAISMFLQYCGHRLNMMCMDFCEEYGDNRKVSPIAKHISAQIASLIKELGIVANDLIIVTEDQRRVSEVNHG